MLLRMLNVSSVARSVGQSVKPLRTKSAVPASAARGLSPDAPAAAPAKRTLQGIALCLIAMSATPAAGACVPGKSDAHCTGATRPVKAARPTQGSARRADRRAVTAVQTSSGGGGGYLDLRRLAPDLMP